MGLLDEAIREHLELMRRRGADPSAIAREEHEALANTYADEPHADDPLDPPAGDLREHDAHPALSPAAEGKDHTLAAQETAELDMRAVMDDLDTANAQAPVGPIPEPPTPGAHDLDTVADDGFSWEMPGAREDDPAPAEIPGQERMTFE